MGQQVYLVGASSFAGAGGVTVSTNGASITISNSPISRLIIPLSPALTAVSVPGNASASIQYVPVHTPITGTRIDALYAWSMGSSAANSVAGIVISAYAAIYTNNLSTLSSLSSGSTQTTYTYNSNSAGNTQFMNASNVYPVSVPVNFNMSQGEYFVAFNMVSASTNTNLGTTVSIMGGNNIQTALNYAEVTNQSATSINLWGGMGVYTAATTGLPVSIAFANIAQTGSSLSQANIALVFRNA